jgi:hypothetical protein
VNAPKVISAVSSQIISSPLIAESHLPEARLANAQPSISAREDAYLLLPQVMSMPTLVSLVGLSLMLLQMGWADVYPDEILVAV